EATRGGIDAVGAAAEIDAVEVELEDLVLREAPLQRHGEDRLAKLAREAAVVVEEDVSGELLGDGRSALPPASLLESDHERSDDADRIDSDMASEAPVLDRDHRVAHHRGDSVEGKP